MTQLDFEGRVAIVTGGGRGMGRSHALMLASRGAKIVVNDYRRPGESEDAAADVVAEIVAAGGQAVASHADVVGGGTAMVEQALDAFGRLDIVVNNAGVVKLATLAEQSAEDWQRVFDIHFQGTVSLCRAAWPHLVKAGAGRIVNTSSTAIYGGPGITNYAAAKAGILGLTRTLALEGEPVGITVNAILPAAWTPMAKAVTPDGEIADILEKHFQPDHVSALVVWLAHATTDVTGEAFDVGCGRASRVVTGMMPAIRVDQSTPEAWAAQRGALLADGPVTPVWSTSQVFLDQLGDVAPDLARKLSGG